MGKSVGHMMRSVAQIGESVDATAISASAVVVAIPNTEDGSPARYVSVFSRSNGANKVVFKPGDSTVTLANMDAGTFLPDLGVPLMLNVSGQTHVAFLAASSDRTVVITALENA